MKKTMVDLIRPIRFRGKKRLLDHFIPKTGLRRARIEGAWIELDLSDLIQRSMYMGAYEPAETRLVKRYLKPGMVMVDIGANVGHFTLLGARRVGPDGRVLAVEPSPYAFGRLDAAITSAGHGHVTRFQGGLSDRDGSLTLHVPPPEAHNHSPCMTLFEGSTPVNVPVRTLDGLLDQWNIQRVDFLKIDVEGHEPRVFAGAARTLARRRIGAILCEFNDYWLRQSASSPRELWAQLHDAGFVDAQSPPDTPHFAPGCLETRLLLLK